MRFKTFGQLVKAYKENVMSKKSKLVISGSVAQVHMVPVDKKTKQPVKDAKAELVFESTVEKLLQDSLRLAGVPFSLSSSAEPDVSKEPVEAAVG